MLHVERLAETMQGEQAEGHPVRHLQLEVTVMFEPIRVEPVEQAADERCSSRPGHTHDQQIGRHRRQREAREQQHVVRDDRMEARRQQGRPAHRGKQHGVRIGEGQALRVEDVAVEERPRVALQLMEHPARFATSRTADRPGQAPSPCAPAACAAAPHRRRGSPASRSSRASGRRVRQRLPDGYLRQVGTGDRERGGNGRAGHPAG